MNSLGCKENAGRLDVTVNNAALVAESQRLQQLMDNHCNVQWTQRQLLGFHNGTHVVRSILEQQEILPYNSNHQFYRHYQIQNTKPICIAPISPSQKNGNRKCKRRLVSEGDRCTRRKIATVSISATFFMTTKTTKPSSWVSKDVYNKSYVVTKSRKFDKLRYLHYALTNLNKI